VAIVLAATAVVAAILGARASLVSSSASGSWQSAIRQEVRRAAGTVEDLRFTYEVEGRQAFRVLTAETLADRYRRQADAATGATRSYLLLEAEAQENVVRSIVESSAIAADPRYRTEDGRFDLALRLADNRAENPELVTTDPDDPQAAGDDAADEAVLLVASTVPVAVAFLFGVLGQGFPNRRRAFLAAGVVFLVLGALAFMLVEVL